MYKERLSIFVDSYDGNKDLWKSLFSIFDHFWPDCPYSRFLVTNNESFEWEKVDVIKTGDDLDWFTTTLIALKKVRTPYVWFFLDDYYFSKSINTTDIEEIIDYIDEKKIFFYRLSTINGLDKTKLRNNVRSDFVYAINLQPVIWNREKFIYFLEKLYNKGCRSPWEFERYFIKHFEKSKDAKVISGVAYDTRDIMGYQNAIIQGKWVRHVVMLYKRKFNIIIDTGNRKYMSYTSELLDYIKRKGHSLLSYKSRKILKRMFKKIGFKFMTN